MALAVPSLRTWTVAEIETAAFFNSNIRDAGTFMLNPPVAVITQATPQSIPNNANTTIGFDSSVLDTYGMHSNVTNNSRAVSQASGLYAAVGISSIVPSGTGSRYAVFTKNGGGIGYSFSPVTAGNAALSGPSLTFTIAQLNAGDYLELQTWQNSGGALNTQSGECAMLLWWIHA